MSRDDVDHVLDSIDGALDDWAVSGDAMRWTPDPPPPPAPRPMTLQPVMVPPVVLQRIRAGMPLHSDHNPPRIRGQRPCLLVVDEAASGDHPPLNFRVTFDTEAGRRFLASMEQANAAYRAAGEAAARGVASMARTLNALSAHLPPEAPADDVRARALRARQNRNTGPQADRFRHRGER